MQVRSVHILNRFHMSTFNESLHTEWNFELLRLALVGDDDLSEVSLRGFTGVLDEPLEAVRAALTRILIRSINTTGTEVGLVGILVFIDDYAFRFRECTEGLFELLGVIQGLIDQSKKRMVITADPCDETQITSDTVRACALTTYTNLLICLDEITESVRSQFIQALMDMSNRRNVKKKEYVNSYLRRVACECLNELELCFPGEVATALGVANWLRSNSLGVPTIVEAVQSEIFVSFEGYAKLLLTCTKSTQVVSGIDPKSLVKVTSLILDSVEFASVWLKCYIALSLSAFLGTAESALWTWSVVQHHFSHFLDSSERNLMHAFLVVAKPFPDWTEEFRAKQVDRLYSAVLDPETQLPVKQLLICWLVSLAEEIGFSASVFACQSNLVPSPSDPPHLAEVKLQALLSLGTIGGSVPRQLLACSPQKLSFARGPRGNVGVMFRFVGRVLLRFGLSVDIPEFLIELIQTSSVANLKVLLPSVIALLRNLEETRVVTNTKNLHAKIDSKTCATPLSALLAHLGEFANRLEPPSRIIDYFPLICYLASLRELDPQFVLTAIDRYLTACESVDWMEGLQILQICRIVILNHETAVVGILEKIHNHQNSHIDIRDKAQLYLRLVSMCGKEQRDGFLAGGGLSHWDVGVVTAPSAIAPIESVRPPVVPTASLVRFEKNFEIRKTHLGDGNWGVFDETAGGITLPFTIQQNGVYGPMYGLELSFIHSTDFAQIAPVSIPFLASQDPPSDSYPHRYEVLLGLVTLNPVPAEIRVNLVFTDRFGISHSGQLGSFSLALEDLFMPVHAERQIEAFKSKWRDPFAKLLSLPRSRVEALIQERLAPFVCPTIGGDCPDFDFLHEQILTSPKTPTTPILPTTASVLIAVPPNFHLMFRFVIGPETCVVWIATDRTDLLLLIDEFFLRWK